MARIKTMLFKKLNGYPYFYAYLIFSKKISNSCVCCIKVFLLDFHLDIINKNLQRMIISESYKFYFEILYIVTIKRVNLRCKFWRKLMSDVFSSERYCSLVNAVSNHNNHSKFIGQIATYEINKDKKLSIRT